ncbi:MAG: COX15/CtaA family protein [Myxococcaceae bacterium]|nr:COX15/CtaA family protein [Myxococcaceae bacterium]
METSPAVASPALRRFAWGTLAFNIVVILWGAYVRATGSGAGCGEHWPLCNGEVIPRAKAIETIIEFSHRASSGLAFLAVLVLLVWALRSRTASAHLKRMSILSMVFMVLESGVGASLVLFRLVAENQSMARAYMMSLHLVNTLLLLASITLAARAASGGAPPKLRSGGAVGAVFGAAALGMIVLGVSGAVTALGDTLWPPQSLEHGLSQDFSPTAHLLLRLRIFHPLLAVVVGLLVVAAGWTALALRPSPKQKRWAIVLTALFATQFCAGLLNVVLLAPVWMQMLHLFLADGVWVALILAGGDALSSEAAGAPAPAPQSETAAA